MAGNPQDTTSYEIHDYWTEQLHLAKIQLRRIAGSAPNLWAIDTTKHVYRLVSGTWEQVTGMDSVISISVGIDGTVAVVREPREVWSFQENCTWKELPSTSPLVQISVGSKYYMMGRTIENDVLYWDGSRFRPLLVIMPDTTIPQATLPTAIQVTYTYKPKSFKMVDVCIAQDGTIVGVTQAKEPCRWDGISWRLIGGNVHLNSIHAASSTQIVGIDSGLKALRYIGNEKWMRLGIPNYCKQLQITPSGIYWGLVFNNTPAPNEKVVGNLFPVYIIRGYPDN